MGKSTVLVVDDIIDTRELCRFVLEREGFNVITAHDAYVAFGLLALHHPDILLLDIMMPEVSGLQLIRMIRTSEEFSKVPIVAITAYKEEYLDEAKRAGASAVLHKPEGLEHLTQTIQNVLAHGRAA